MNQEFFSLLIDLKEVYGCM